MPELAPQSNADKPVFVETRTEHRALSQLHRWYELYERAYTPERIQRQLEILHPDVKVISVAGEAKGHDEYVRRVRALPPTDRNAHHVKRTAVTKDASGAISLTADIVYQRLQADGNLVSMAIHYDARLEDPPGALPVFTEVRITAVGPVNEPTFVDAYRENRVSTFMHRWLALMEDLSEGSAGFDELLAKGDFSLFLSSADAPITTREQLAEWARGGATRIRQGSHRFHSLKTEETAEGQYRVLVDFDWVGLTHEGRTMVAKTHHEWLLDDTGERFLRMKRMNVTALEPFRLVD